MSEPSPEGVGDIGSIQALAIVLGVLIVLLLVIGLVAFLTLNNPAVL